MAIVEGLTTRFNLHVRANEHGSGAGRTSPIILFGPAGAVGESGKEVSDLEGLHVALAPLLAGRIVSASLCPQADYVGPTGQESFCTFRPNDLPEANDNRHAQVLLTDSTGSITQKVTIPFVLPGTTEAQIAAALLANLVGSAAKLRLSPLLPTVAVDRVARVQFTSRL